MWSTVVWLSWVICCLQTRSPFCDWFFDNMRHCFVHYILLHHFLPYKVLMIDDSVIHLLIIIHSLSKSYSVFFINLENKIRITLKISGPLCFWLPHKNAFSWFFQNFIRVCKFVMCKNQLHIYLNYLSLMF